MSSLDSTGARPQDQVASESVAAPWLLALAAGVATSAWLLLLFGLALAWDPLDRRLGFRDRRWAERRAALPAVVPASNGAYGVRPASARASDEHTPAAA